MDTRKSIAAALAATLMLAGCAKTQEEPKEEPKAEAPAVDLAAEEQAVRNRSAEWMNYANAKDVATIVNGIFSPDAIAVSGDGDVRKGSAAIQAGMEKDVKEMPDAVVSWTTTTVKVAASGDLAVEKGDYYFDPDGSGKKPATAGTFVTVWEKIDGNWRATTDVAAENAAPAT
ncbi:MAG: nuclear transport factor 2 family protein [Steroidobacteraceae bacterium]